MLIGEEAKPHDSALEMASFHLSKIQHLKYGPVEAQGWGPRQRARFGYHTPDDWYEALLFARVTAEIDWLDVGCGRDVLPSNKAAAKILSQTCRLLVGLDPSDNIDDNNYVHERVKAHIEAYRTDRQFDLITLRMVAEHIARPQEVVGALSRLAKPGGRVIVYTVSKWAPVSIAAALTPMSVHHAVKRFLWRTEPRDTFPVEYKMNTRKDLLVLFEKGGFREESFCYLDDCRTLQRWKLANAVELSAWRALKWMGMNYPETCILAIYRKQAKP